MNTIEMILDETKPILQQPSQHEPTEIRLASSTTSNYIPWSLREIELAQDLSMKGYSHEQIEAEIRAKRIKLETDAWLSFEEGMKRERKALDKFNREEKKKRIEAERRKEIEARICAELEDKPGTQT